MINRLLISTTTQENNELGWKIQHRANSSLIGTFLSNNGHAKGDTIKGTDFSIWCLLKKLKLVDHQSSIVVDSFYRITLRWIKLPNPSILNWVMQNNIIQQRATLCNQFLIPSKKSPPPSQPISLDPKLNILISDTEILVSTKISKSLRNLSQ